MASFFEDFVRNDPLYSVRNVVKNNYENVFPLILDNIHQFGGGRIPSQIRNHYTLSKLRDQRSAKYCLTFTNWECKVRSLSHLSFEDLPRTISEILSAILDDVLKTVAPKDKVRIRLDSRYLDYVIWTPPIQRDQITVERIMLEVSRVLQSHDEFRLDDTFSLWVQHAAIPSGACSTIESAENRILCQKLQAKRCVISIRNRDEICLARALVVGRAFADGNKKLLRTMSNIKTLTHFTDRTKQTLQALELIKRADLSIRRYNIADLEAFHLALGQDYMIVVIGVEQLNSVIYATPWQEKRITLLYHSQHFDVLTSLPAWFERNMYCFHCLRCYDIRENHRCAYTCKQCLRQTCTDRVSVKKPIHCSACNRDFHGPDCFAAHKQLSQVQDPKLVGRNICQKMYVCSDCHRFVSTVKRDKDSKHRCGEIFCAICRIYCMPGEHTCYMKPHLITPKEMKDHQEARFLYLDFETYQNDEGLFVPNVAVLIDDENEVTIFPADTSTITGDIINDVCNFIFQPAHRGFFVLAHNFRGFDGYFILKWLTKNGIAPDVIMDGSKVLRLDVKEFGIKFRDTLSYVPLSLSNWATAFQVDQAKGMFPHPVNCKENWNRVITYPNRKEYGYTTMSKKSRKQFIKIYRRDRRKKRNQFNVNEELISYCIQDVRTLKSCAESLRLQFQELSGGLCIFSSALTIAGVCGFFWRSRILKEEEVELVHRPSRRTSSLKAQKWLHMMERKDDVLNMETEVHIGSYFVDGFDGASMTVYEFYGKR